MTFKYANIRAHFLEPCDRRTALKAIRAALAHRPTAPINWLL